MQLTTTLLVLVIRDRFRTEGECRAQSQRMSLDAVAAITSPSDYSIRWRSKVSLVDYCVYLRVACVGAARVCERDGPPSARPHAAPTHVAGAPSRGPHSLSLFCQTATGAGHRYALIDVRHFAHTVFQLKSDLSDKYALVRRTYDTFR